MILHSAVQILGTGRLKYAHRFSALLSLEFSIVKLQDFFFSPSLVTSCLVNQLMFSFVPES